ncbi:unnamed protein product [Owenia fusiformis]|uniref:Uncharacterized protein n=1 Tax=Owenia fusiformis TaxID=6347 RepID=A0A8J1USM4_OWEFU|nr:unnamed protein product [Owenia fusiformis]
MANHFRFLRQYRGPLKACILDWSGTTADKYVLAPAVVFAEVFKKHKVPISMAEARGPMGLRKDLHIDAITKVPEVRERWKDVYGRYPNQEDVDNMFKDFVPMQLDCLRQYTDLLPGCADAVNRMKNEFGMKIGTTTGFLRSMVDILAEEAAKQGYVPDVTVAGDEVINGARPNPHMVYRNMDLLNIQTIQSVVKVDDTVTGVGEALNAGCWAVGVAKYSNYMDIDDFEHEASLSKEEMARRLAYSTNLLVNSGAHYVVDSIADLPAVCEDINERLKRGETPM